jgi:tetraacyldisaccharide 4'-kinase
MKPMEYRVITKAMSLYPYQQLFFSTHVYEPLRPVFPKNAKTLGNFKDMNVLLLSGIASPEQMLIDLQERASQITPLSFSDHHNFSQKDIMHINEVFAGLPSPKVIITTEKDETRLLNTEGLSDEVKRSLYVLPVKVSFMLDQEETFNKHIISYVRKNSRNSILAKGKDDNKSKDSDHSGDRPRTISFRNN